MNFFAILGTVFPPRATIDVKFCTAYRTEVPLGCTKFHVNWCNESPLRGEKPDFWHVSKFNTGSLPLYGILPVKMLKNYVRRFQSNSRIGVTYIDS